MQKIDKIDTMREAAGALRRDGKRLALVPTLGALHAGHTSLIRLARSRADAVVVSAFVNPLQFGPSEDLVRYPRTPAADAALCEQEKVELLFTPAPEEMFPRGFSTTLLEDAVSRPLCGVSRPALFRGMLTCWLKLFNIVRPDLVVLGEKDAQQTAVARKVAADLLLPLEIITGPTVRDPDGLAVSARNTYLTPSQREEALAVYGALRKAKEMVEAGVKSPDRLVAEVTHLIAAKRRLRVIYISVVDRNTMEPLREVAPGHCLLAISFWVDEIRLTDNMPL
jgi:pantoate--beta-alanine ligase